MRAKICRIPIRQMKARRALRGFNEGPLSQRIAEKAIQFWRGEEADVIRWLESLGCVVTRSQPGEYCLMGIAGCNSALTKGDPNTIAVCIGFLLAGMYWPQVYPSLQSRVNALWKESTGLRGK